MAEMEAQGQDMPTEPVQSMDMPANQLPAEKLLSQSEVNEIAGRVRQDGYEKGRQDGLNAAKSHAPEHPPQMSEDALRHMMREEAARVQEERLREAIAQKVIGDFTNKMQTGQSKYEDFAEVVAPLDLPKIPEIVELANAVENTSDVMYELGKHPEKVANLLTLSRQAPHLAQVAMNRLSQSIMSNEKAKSEAPPGEPLSQMKPSNVSTDGGQMSLKDFMKQPYLRR